MHYDFLYGTIQLFKIMSFCGIIKFLTCTILGNMFALLRLYLRFLLIKDTFLSPPQVPPALRSRDGRSSHTLPTENRSQDWLNCLLNPYHLRILCNTPYCLGAKLTLVCVGHYCIGKSNGNASNQLFTELDQFGLSRSKIICRGAETTASAPQSAAFETV